MEQVKLIKTGTLTPAETPTNQSSNTIDTIPTSSIHDNQRIGAKQRGLK